MYFFLNLPFKQGSLGEIAFISSSSEVRILGSGWYTPVATPGQSSSFALSGFSFFGLDSRMLHRELPLHRPGVHEFPGGFLMPLDYPVRSLAWNLAVDP